MSDRRVIAYATMDAASNTSQTSAFEVPKDYSHFAIVIPAANTWCQSTVCGLAVLTADSLAGPFRKIGYSNNPATVTSDQVFWDSPKSAAVSGSVIICEALMFAQKYAKIQFTNTATATTAFPIIGTNYK